MAKKGKESMHNPSNKAQERREKQQARKERMKRIHQTWSAQSRDLELFRIQLEPLGLVLRDVQGDGNCLFRSLSDQMYGDATHHSELRKAVATFIRTHREDFEPFRETEDEEETFDEYVDSMATNGVYVGHWALVAFSRHFQVNITIHQVGQPIWQIFTDVANQYTPTLHIAYFGHEHYSSVRREDTPTGPASVDIKPTHPSLDPKKVAKAQADVKAKSAELLSWNEKMIMESTGCQDIFHIRQVLTQCNNDLQEALDIILNELEFADIPDVDIPPEAAFASSSSSASGDLVNDEASSQSKDPAPASTASTAKAKGKAAANSSTTPHLSNRQRKEQAKKARKERRQEEQRVQAQHGKPTEEDILAPRLQAISI